MTYPAIVGQVLAQLRKKKGFDQTAVAAAVGLKHSAWSRIERGEVSVTVEQLAMACGKLGVTPQEVLAMADGASKEAERQGMKVELGRVLGAGLVVVGAAAIAALAVAGIAAVVSLAMDDDTPKPTRRG